MNKLTPGKICVAVNVTLLTAGTGKRGTGVLGWRMKGGEAR
jgi:hypothetical protein